MDDHPNRRNLVKSRGPRGLLLGRESELAHLDGAVDWLAQGRGSMVLIEGEPGIGKSRLLEELAHRAKARGLSVYQGAADELAQHRPFGAIEACLRPRRISGSRASTLVKLLEHQGTPAGQNGPFQGLAGSDFATTEATLALVEELAAAAPLALVLDDAHWADAGTLVSLHRLGRLTSQLSVLLVCAFRPLPRPPELARLLAELSAGDALKLTVGPLDEVAMPALAQVMLGARVGGNLRQMIKSCGGNPLFLIELVGALEKANALTRAGDSVDVVTSSIPPSLTLTILHRLSFLDAPAKELLRRAAVLGSSFTVEELALASGRPVAQLVAPLETAIDAGVLEEEGALLRFRHDLIRESLYQDLPLALRVALHRDLARTLLAAGAPAERVAEHHLRGARPGDREAVDSIQRAVWATASRAPGLAAELLGGAIRLLGAGDPDRERLIAEQVNLLRMAGRLRDAEALCRRALARTLPEAAEIELKMALASCLVTQSRMAEAVEVVVAVRDHPALLPAAQIRLAALEAWARLNLGQREAVALAQRNLAEAESIGEVTSACMSFQTLAVWHRLAARQPEAISLADRGLDLAQASPDAEARQVPISLWKGLCLIDLDRLTEAQEVLQHGLRLSEAAGSSWNLPLYHLVAATGHYHAGDWDDALAELQTGLELAEGGGTGWTTVNHTLQALIALHRGDLSQADRALQAAERQHAASGMTYRLASTMRARALLLEARGERQAAWDLLVQAWERASSQSVLELPGLGPDVVRMSLDFGDRALGRTVAHTLEEIARRWPAPSVQGAAGLCAGLAGADTGRLMDAVEECRSSGRPFELARAAELAAAGLARSGHVPEAKALTEEALSLYEGLQASREAARAEARLREAGVRRGVRGVRRRPRAGWASLTATELTVARLVAEGLSNPKIADELFLSRRTVATHVSHILGKLGLSTRIELATEAVRRGIGTQG